MSEIFWPLMLLPIIVITVGVAVCINVYADKMERDDRKKHEEEGK